MPVITIDENSIHIANDNDDSIYIDKDGLIVIHYESYAGATIGRLTDKEILSISGVLENFVLKRST